MKRLETSVRPGRFLGEGQMLSCVNRLAAGLVLLCAVFAYSPAPTAHAQTDANLTWRFHSNYPYTIHMEFYSRQYGRKWPAGEVYVINPNQGGYASLSCAYGEYICYGAWVLGNPSTYWGVGRGGHQGCARCCATCGHGEPTQINLDP